MRIAAVVALVVGAAGPGIGAAGGAPDIGLTRYSLAHGCVTIDTPAGPLLPDAGPYRMQPTALGEYLLYSHDGEVLDAATGSIHPVQTPSQTTVWRVDGSAADGFTLTNAATGTATPATFTPATGCADYPEAEVGATGTPGSSIAPDGSVIGTIDAHVHVTAFEFLGGDFHCGRPWHPYGVTFALPDCAPYRTGSNGLVANFLDYGAPVHDSDTRGWPSFRDWPRPSKLSTEGTYWTGIQRAWLAGLRMMTIDVVDNESLCAMMTDRRNPCDDMASVRTQITDLYALQDYIDAQAGGPGLGFFRLVTDPAEARRVAGSGKLAVVIGMELSDPMGCGVVQDRPKCDAADVDRWLTELRRLGVTSFFPVHKFDDAFGGTKMDANTTGLLVNIGNYLQTGTFWNIQTCPGSEHDNTQYPIPGFYPVGPDCNTRGLTDLGKYLINKMIDLGFLIEIDHMDEATADQALTIIESRHYPGVLSSHGWDSTRTTQRVYAAGGFVTPYAGSPAAFVQKWRDARVMSKPTTDVGFGYGSDMNGLGAQGAPIGGNLVSYPFTSIDGQVTFDKERWGDRTFDINTDGVASYGTYADWLEALRILGGPDLTTEMMHGAESYLRLWQQVRS
ncbi:peptidase [Nocardia sp. NPDC059240]|uniref:peptidase n=1 Tax=Nocardia sp. NPDC059240 TaxID=3346786 RepID=UPI0036B8BA62